MVRECLFLRLLVAAAAAVVMCSVMRVALASGEAVVSSESLMTSDAYEKIETYGFPRGILPPTVTGYNLEANGRFILYLERDCRVLIEEKYPLEYDKVITGVLSYGQLEDLQGIKVKAFYVWWDITAISRNSNDLLFVIGILSAKFPLENFDDPPVCDSKLTTAASLWWWWPEDSQGAGDDDAVELLRSRKLSSELPSA